MPDKPTWEELVARATEVERLRASLPKALGEMHIAHGVTTGKRCGDCRHLFKLIADMQVQPFKCRKYRTSLSASSDWRKKWQACGLFEERDGGEA